MFSARVPTLISDQLWDRFIEEHYGKTSRYLAPALSSAREPSDGSTNSASSDVSEKSETRHVSSERIRERGKRRNANSRKWKSFRICEMQRSKRRERGREMRSRTKRKKTTKNRRVRSIQRDGYRVWNWWQEPQTNESFGVSSQAWIKFSPIVNIFRVGYRMKFIFPIYLITCYFIHFCIHFCAHALIIYVCWNVMRFRHHLFVDVSELLKEEERKKEMQRNFVCVLLSSVHSVWSRFMQSEIFQEVNMRKLAA